jgi:hypothetical protein
MRVLQNIGGLEWYAQMGQNPYHTGGKSALWERPGSLHVEHHLIPGDVSLDTFESGVARVQETSFGLCWDTATTVLFAISVISVLYAAPERL